MWIFRDVRESRERILLDILGLMRKSGATNPRDIAIRGLKLAYSCVYDNIKFLEERGFVRLLKRRRAGAKLYDLTIRGLLASLFSPTYPPREEELEVLCKRDWGPRYIEPFQNVKSLLSLKEAVETIYNFGGSLEEINEDILMRVVRDSHDINRILDLLRHAKVVPFSFKVQEPGRYVASIPSIPGSFAFCKIQKALEGKEIISLVINPTLETSEKLAEIIKNPNNEDYVGKLTANFLEDLAYAISGGRGVFIRYYNPETRQFIIAGAMPAEVTQRLLYPEQILEYMQMEYQSMVEWLKDAEKKENRSIFAFMAREYDPESKQIRSLSKDEIRKKAAKVLEMLKGDT